MKLYFCPIKGSPCLKDIQVYKKLKNPSRFIYSKPPHVTVFCAEKW